MAGDDASNFDNPALALDQSYRNLVAVVVRNERLAICLMTALTTVVYYDAGEYFFVSGLALSSEGF